MATITEPILLDTTGQDIVRAIEEVRDALKDGQVDKYKGSKSRWNKKKIEDLTLLSSWVANGEWDNIQLGNYIEVDTSLGKAKGYIMAINPFYGGYNNQAIVSTPHLGIVWVWDSGLTHAWNPTNTTVGGYAGSDIHSYLKDTVLPTLENAIGSSHFLSHSKLLSNTINTTGTNRLGANSGCSNNWSWENTKIALLSEVQVYGSIVWSSSGFDTGEARSQLDGFKLVNAQEVWGGQYPWLRDVAGATFASFVDHGGSAHYNYASSAYGVCPLTLYI